MANVSYSNERFIYIDPYWYFIGGVKTTGIIVYKTSTDPTGTDPTTWMVDSRHNLDSTTISGALWTFPTCAKIYGKLYIIAADYVDNDAVVTYENIYDPVADQWNYSTPNIVPISSGYTLSSTGWDIAVSDETGGTSADCQILLAYKFCFTSMGADYENPGVAYKLGINGTWQDWGNMYESGGSFYNRYPCGVHGSAQEIYMLWEEGTFWRQRKYYNGTFIDGSFSPDVIDERVWVPGQNSGKMPKFNNQRGKFYWMTRTNGNQDIRIRSKSTTNSTPTTVATISGYYGASNFVQEATIGFHIDDSGNMLLVVCESNSSGSFKLTFLYNDVAASDTVWTDVSPTDGSQFVSVWTEIFICEVGGIFYCLLSSANVDLGEPYNVIAIDPAGGSPVLEISGANLLPILTNSNGAIKSDFGLSGVNTLPMLSNSNGSVITQPGAVDWASLSNYYDIVSADIDQAGYSYTVTIGGTQVPAIAVTITKGLVLNGDLFVRGSVSIPYAYEGVVSAGIAGVMEITEQLSGVDTVILAGHIESVVSRGRRLQVTASYTTAFTGGLTHGLTGVSYIAISNGIQMIRADVNNLVNPTDTVITGSAVVRVSSVALYFTMGTRVMTISNG